MVVGLGTEPFDLGDGLCHGHAFKGVELLNMGLEFSIVVKG